MLNNKESFSLVELLVFVGILSIFFIMAASVVTVSLRNMKFNEHKIKATHYANQLEEWLKSEKEKEWGGNICSSCPTVTNFTEAVSRQGTASDGYKTTYCFNDPIIEFWTEPASCTDFALDSTFKREVVFTSNVSSNYIDQVSASITVYWNDLNQEKKVVSNTLFSIFE